jgi:hypothetical protein
MPRLQFRDGHRGEFMRKFAAAVLTAGVTVGLLGVAPASAQDDNTAFCDVALQIENAVNQEAFDELDALFTQAESTVPPELAPALSVVVTAIRGAIETESDPSGDPVFEENNTTVTEYVYENCGWQQAEVTMSEYEFSGLPKSFTAGPVALKITNDGAEVHEFVPLRIKNKKDKLRKIIGLPEKKAMKKIQVLGHEFAAPGATTYAFFDFSRPGNYGAVCFIPVGSTPEAVEAAEAGGEGGEGGDEHGGIDGPPHALEGMYASFKVTAA